MKDHGRGNRNLWKSLAVVVGILVVAYAYALHASPFPRDDLVTAGQFKAHTYLDPQTRTIFYVETDGRHLSAIGPDGKLLWTRNPYVETGSHYYRRKEVIDYLGPLSADYMQFMKTQKVPGPFIGIGFDSTQFGALDVKTGTFYNLGQD
jgi:hypothetical protein